MKKSISGFIVLVLALALGGQTQPLTRHDDMMAMLRKLDASSPLVSMTPIGRSVQKREIPALFFSKGKFAGRREQKPIVLIFCQQHGDEASGKEAALKLAAGLLRDGQAVLEKLDLILVPCANPDGAELKQRRNANGRDLNRNHVLLSEPETLALHHLFQQWFPEIVLDVHEYGAVSTWWVGQGAVKNADEMLGALSNLNIDAAIRAFSQDVFYPAMKEKVTRDGFIFFPYLVGAPVENDRVRFSTTDIDDGRQGLGIYNTLAFILEGKRYGSVENMLDRRTATQLSAMTAFLKTAAERGGEILAMVRSARARLLREIAPGERALVRMDYFPDPARPTIAVPVFNLEEWRAEVREWGRFEPLVKVKKSVSLPAAYIIPGSETGLVALLRRHQVQLFRLTAPAEAVVERYRVLHATGRIEEESPKPEFDLERTTAKVGLQPGDVVAWLPQRARLLLPLLLEPESSWGILTDSGGVASEFSAYAREGGTCPVMRLMEKLELSLEEIH
ncbi:MAG: succinylglutamate desuccinylase/aspartoacylase family protein [Acidobacteria bacterium]|jgi:hypothetical protein|nr:succinylglutamate desuccinylase/aspartoacylase family protein [Acidobacteriota bacterium]